MPGRAVEKPGDDRAFIERAMYTGRASRQPVRRLLPRLVPVAFMLTGGVGFLTGRLTSGEVEPSLFELPGGLGLVFIHTLMGTALCAGGLYLLRQAVQAYRTDRALARQARSMHEP